MDPFHAAIRDELRRTSERDRPEGLLARWARRAGYLVGWVFIHLLGRGGQR